jgi:hypothetical protein
MQNPDAVHVGTQGRHVSPNFTNEQIFWLIQVLGHEYEEFPLNNQEV